MTNKLSPFLETQYGWPYGANNWNPGMDENLLKFSFMFDGRVDGVVASLPAAVNGQSYFLTTDKRLYFAVGTTWYSSPCPQYFVFKIKSTGDYYQYDGSNVVQIDSPTQAESRFTSIEATLASLGTAAFEDVADLATQAELDVASAQANAYTDTLRSDLADAVDPAKGAALVGYDGGTAADFLDSLSDPLQGAVKIAMPDGNVSQYLQYVTLEALGGVPDNDTPAAHSANKAALLRFRDMGGVRELRGRGGAAYYFGGIAGDTALCVFTRPVDIDWCGAELIVDGDNSQGFTGTTFVQFLDTGNSSMRNYTFDDRNFTFAGPSRGVMPVAITNVAKSTEGYTLGPFQVRRGQSLLTAYSDTGAHKARGIKFVGDCGGGTCYYGVNLANNGDGFVGCYHIQEANRALFVYGVSGFVVDLTLDVGNPSSAHLLIANSGTGFPITAGGRVRAHIGELNGPVLITDNPIANGTGVYSDIDIDFSFDSLGPNITTGVPIIRIGSSGGSSIRTDLCDVSMDNIRINANTRGSPLRFDNPIQIYTPSPNYGLFELSGNVGCNRAYMYPLNYGPTLLADGRRSVMSWGSSNPKVCVVPSRHLALPKKNTPVVCSLRIEASNNSGGQHFFAEYSIIGQLSSVGAFALADALQIFSRATGGVTPTVTISAADGGAGLQVSLTGYAENGSYLVASVSLS